MILYLPRVKLRSLTFGGIMQHIHILGICGTFMGSLAQLAKAKGYMVTGCDHHVYPPMSTQLEAAGIELIEGFSEDQLDLQPDLFVVGNVVSRGNPLMETILNRNLPYTSGPQWFAEHILSDRWVMAVAGTHGKTTTTSMLTWILEHAGMAPGYLIGGVPQNFNTSASLGSSAFFVVEADEYDCAFFDKRSKFIHYHPRTLIMNNLEFDHADIFPNLKAIQTQFHHLVRTVPGDGLILYPQQDEALREVLAMGCWTPTQTLGGDWTTQRLSEGNDFAVLYQGKEVGRVNWDLSGRHNVHNALAAIAAARHVGVDPALACEALGLFQGVKRRMELVGEARGVRVFDDFAHHPTAIQSTLEGVRAQYPDHRITAVIEPRSNTMKLGVHKDALKQSCRAADRVYWLEPENFSWSLAGTQSAGNTEHHVCRNTQEIVRAVASSAVPGELVVVMSNGAFDGIHAKLIRALQES
jgi:UDP-N-acetylmuramate: L-alanyl-gamma-D-glutamyl-meso-diaminopimelate ligase